jgi:hypothetical protein
MTKRVAIVLVAAAVLVAPALVGAAPRPTEDAVPVAARVPVKPTGPIAVEYRLAAPPAVGVPLELAVTARVEPGVGNLTIEADASTPRAVLVAAPELVTAADGVYVWRITVVPLAADAGYLTVIVAGDLDGLAQARSVTVSLRGSGSPGAAPAPEAGGGEVLIALPAQEGP